MKLEKIIATLYELIKIWWWDTDVEGMKQLLAWFEELQAYRDTGLTPEQVNLTEATLWKEQGLIARESDRRRGRWVRDVVFGFYDCSECGWTDYSPHNYCSLCGAEMEIDNSQRWEEMEVDDETD